jgi:hypothetical protein
MKYLASVLVVLSLAGISSAGDKEIAERLRKAGVKVIIPWGLDEEGYLVELDGRTIEAALPDLCELRTLRRLYVYHSGLTEAQLRTVCALPLRELVLSGAPVTDAQLKEVTRLRGLQALALDQTQITDAGLKDLTRMGDLNFLSLEGTAVTDAGLRHLEGLGQLRYLLLRGCPNVNGEGVARLKEALPKCEIYH